MVQAWVSRQEQCCLQQGFAMQLGQGAASFQQHSSSMCSPSNCQSRPAAECKQTLATQRRQHSQWRHSLDACLHPGIVHEAGGALLDGGRAAVPALQQEGGWVAASGRLVGGRGAAGRHPTTQLPLWELTGTNSLLQPPVATAMPSGWFLQGFFQPFQGLRSYSRPTRGEEGVGLWRVAAASGRRGGLLWEPPLVPGAAASASPRDACKSNAFRLPNGPGMGPPTHPASGGQAQQGAEHDESCGAHDCWSAGRSRKGERCFGGRAAPQQLAVAVLHKLRLRSGLTCAQGLLASSRNRLQARETRDLRAWDAAGTVGLPGTAATARAAAASPAPGDRLCPLPCTAGLHAGIGGLTCLT